MTDKQLEFVRECVRERRLLRFYNWRKWKAKRLEVLAKDRYECQICKERGKYSRAEIVHHVRHLLDHPELALADTFIGRDGKEHRQLISVCRNCHETVCHPERIRREPQRERFSPPESWD